MAPEDYIAKYVVKTDDISMDRPEKRDLCQLIPKKGETLPLETNLQEALQEKSNIYFNFEATPTLFDTEKYIIRYRPVSWTGNFVSRIVVTGLAVVYQEDLKNNLRLI